MENLTTAYFIAIKDKFFYSFSKDKRVLTSWTLAAAKFYAPYMVDDLFLDNEFQKTIRLLDSKKIKYRVKKISIVCLSTL